MAHYASAKSNFFKKLKNKRLRMSKFLQNQKFETESCRVSSSPKSVAKRGPSVLLFGQCVRANI